MVSDKNAKRQENHNLGGAGLKTILTRYSPASFLLFRAAVLGWQSQVKTVPSGQIHTKQSLQALMHTI